MPDPLALLSLALAARGGRIDGHPASGLVAAGHALLQRSAGVVRALSGRRSAILLPPGAAFLTALAASDGRGALLIDPTDAERSRDLTQRFKLELVGAVFTVRSMAHCVPQDLAAIYLDDSPRGAVVRTGELERPVDLGAHFGLDLAGDEATDGSTEECICIGRQWFTHRDVIRAARADAVIHGFTPMHEEAIINDWSAELVTRIAAVLLHGGRVVSPRGGG